IYDICQTLREVGTALSPASISLILKEEGFARLPRRGDEERAGVGVAKAATADCDQLDLSPHRLRTKFGGIFLFLPDLASLPFDRMLKKAGLPGSSQIPAPHAWRSLLALKLFGNARPSHVMSSVFDEGLALFAGLNVIPKRAFLTEYSCRVKPDCYPKLMRNTTSPSAAAVRKGFWPFWPKTPRRGSSATATRLCARLNKTTKSCALSSIGANARGGLLMFPFPGSTTSTSALFL